MLSGPQISELGNDDSTANSSVRTSKTGGNYRKQIWFTSPLSSQRMSTYNHPAHPPPAPGEPSTAEGDLDLLLLGQLPI